MELSDLVSDIKSNKVMGVAFFGAITGFISGVIDFEESMGKSKRQSFRKVHNKFGKEGIKNIIAATGGITSINYKEGTIINNIFEGLVYTAEFRISYEIGHKGYNIIKNYLNKKD